MIIAVIKWGDAWVDFHDLSLEEAAQLSPIVRYTVGYFVKETEQAYILCTDYYEEAGDINSPMVIPKGMVISIKFLNQEINSHEDSTP